MNFSDQLNDYIDTLSCTAKELAEVSGISASTLSRYRSGDRIPELNSGAFERLCEAISTIAADRNLSGITKNSVKKSFLSCQNMTVMDREQLRQNFNLLLSTLNVNISRLCQQTNYDSSTIFRFRNGSRQPSEPQKFAFAVAEYIAAETNDPDQREILSKLLGCPCEELADYASRSEKIESWLLRENVQKDACVSGFLSKLDEFDLNKYIKAIHFDELKLPPVMPFHFPTSKSYFGLEAMMDSELDFLKATVLSRSSEPVIMYSDMPMEQMAKNPDFPKKWMFGMAMMLKKGLHLNQIHNLDRSFEDMMLGLESWIPMYMTGQVSPYYLRGVQNNAFLHLIKVSGAAALTGEGISGYHEDGKYYLTKSKDEVAYYQKRANELLKNASPLMDIYREDNAGGLHAFLTADSHTAGKRRNILSSLPIYTMEESFLKQFLTRRSLPEKKVADILAFAATARQMIGDILSSGTLQDEISPLTKEEFDGDPMSLSLSGMFHETDIPYTWEEYLAHLEQTRNYAESHAGYRLIETSHHTFRNLQINIHEGKWAMVSKNQAPAIHFVIQHPKLREAIENFVPPLIEDQE